MAESKLNIIIVGSGLAGLGAASVLREHHNVTVYERGGSEAATGGQGICLFSNGVKILQSIGFDADRSGGVPCHGYRLFDKAGKRVKDFPIDFKGRYGADTLTMKRSDFREELLRLATAPPADGIKGEPVRMVFNTAVDDVDPEAASVTLHDGSVITGDVVIIADGVHSRLRKRITGDETHRAKKNGNTCYRIAISSAEVKEALGYLPEWWHPETADNRINALQTLDGTNRMVAPYPLRHYEYMNISCLFPTRKDRGDIEESWYADGDRKELISTFDDFYEPIRKILSIAKEVKVWDLQDMDPLPNWHRGRAIVIGDAAHAMTPMQGQGANMAMEDADSLRLLLLGMKEDDIKSVLAKIDAVRRPRAARVLQDTRLQADEITMEERLANMDYNCSYNGVYEALKELE
ncbi:FAD binding domain protein [Fusarium sp. LHS14.1]|nr:FAD binding domain protein [Fusarium sp. LHS14.1]